MWKLATGAGLALMMSACSSGPDRLPIKIDASLMQECGDWVEPRVGENVVGYTDRRRAQYMICQERHRGLVGAVDALTGDE